MCLVTLLNICCFFVNNRFYIWLVVAKGIYGIIAVFCILRTFHICLIVACTVFYVLIIYSVNISPQQAIQRSRKHQKKMVSCIFEYLYISDPRMALVENVFFSVTSRVGNVIDFSCVASNHIQHRLST